MVWIWPEGYRGNVSELRAAALPQDVGKLSRYRSFPSGLLLQGGLKQLTQNILVMLYLSVDVSVYCLTSYSKWSAPTQLDCLGHSCFLTDFAEYS